MNAPASPACAVLQNASMIDFPGHLAAVFFVSGCNFRCGFCHNFTAMSVRKPGFSWERLDALCARFKRDWSDGAVVTGGEPTLDPHLREFLVFLRERGFAIKLDTNGSRPEVLEPLLDLVDYVAMDIKGSPDQYPELTGFADVARIRDSVQLLKTRVPKHEFRTTVLEPVHTEDAMHDIGRLIDGAALYVLQPMVPREDLPDSRWRSAPRTHPDRLRELADLMKPFASQVTVRDR